MPQFDRITQQAGLMGGKACIRGLRVTVGTIVGQIAAGHTIDEVLADPAASGWLKTALRSALCRDPVDAANDSEILARLLQQRCDRILSES